jgi:hypothetical protein
MFTGNEMALGTQNIQEGHSYLPMSECQVSPSFSKQAGSFIGPRLSANPTVFSRK